MTQEDLASAIAGDIRTLDEAGELRERLLNIRGHLYQSSTNYELLLQDCLPFKIWQRLQKFLDKETFGNNPRQFESFLNSLEEWISRLPVLKLELAYEPTVRSVGKISHWLKQNYPKTHVLLDFTINPDLIGGSRIYYQGKTKDYSLKRRLKDTPLT